MKFQFKHQKFQADAASAICELFSGQSKQSENFFLSRDDEIKIGSNAPLELTDEQLLKNLRGVQSKNNLPISERLEGRNFSVEMETGVGKTYTYIKTMYEFNKNYGWSKFIIVVPSVAIREGVKKSFAMTEEHFAEEYGEKIRHFVYSSKNLSVIKSFVSDSKIWAMIVNVQAFNSSNENRRMLQELDEFNSQIPIEVIAQINPIMIIDEPQSVEGKKARQKIPEFKPLITLRYSATHRNIFNLVYRLDALDAYQKRLVKKISVKGIEKRGGNSAGYIFFEAVNLSKKAPTATLTFKRKGANDIKKITRKISVGNNLYELSNGLDEYKNNFVVTEIDGAEYSIQFLNGTKLFVGQVIGDVDEAELRRIQIRETIQSHLERESELFGRGIKVLSLFFIDEVAKYRQYDENTPLAGIYAKIFEEEYISAVQNFQADTDYKNYLENISAQDTHAGYFSADKKNRAINSKEDDADAYNLIMRDKEKLLDLRTPVRFIFSHSALREGWDNPNVFQICTLKQSTSDVRRRQEVGRGMRLCVNQRGERMDEDKIGEDIHRINVLTVVANESYQTFAAGLQEEIAEAINRPKIFDREFFIGKKIGGQKIDEKLSKKIYRALILQDYLDEDDHLTEKFFTDKANGTINFGAELEPARESLIKLLSGDEYKITNARADNVAAKLDEQKLSDKNFQTLWARISRKGFYTIDFDSEKFITTAAAELNKKLLAAESYFVIEGGTLNDDGVFNKNSSRTEKFQSAAIFPEINLVGKLVEATGLTRREVTKILRGLEPLIFEQLKINPEKFIPDAAKIINVAKAAQVAENINYTAIAAHFDIKIFHTADIKGRLNHNAIATAKNLYDYLIYDSDVEKNFAAALETADEVSVYVKLPKSFYIPTPLGRYNPDWAIVMREGEIKNIYFVVETKGASDDLQLRGIEKIKIACARKYFDEIAGGKVKYHVAENYHTLSEIFRSDLDLR